MSEPIRGSYPGGPRRGTGPESDRLARRIEPVSALEERLSRRKLDRTRRRRARRLLLGFLGAMIVSGAVGVFVGLDSHATQAELTEAQRVVRERDVDISREVNRTLLQLWKMEEIEALRGRGGIR